MRRILIIGGASGSISKIVEDNLLNQAAEVQLTLLLRYPEKFPLFTRESNKVQVVQADVFEESKLINAVRIKI